jgi:hypothetical protein
MTNSEMAPQKKQSEKQTDKLIEVPSGLYEHYKGMPYRVIGTGRHSETLEQFVLYESLYENELGRLWVRPAAMFVETVPSPKGDGTRVPRFRHICK